MNNIETVFLPEPRTFEECVDDAYEAPEREFMLFVAHRLPEDEAWETLRVMRSGETVADRVIDTVTTAKKHSIAIPEKMFNAAVIDALEHPDTEEWNIQTLRSFQIARN